MKYVFELSNDKKEKLLSTLEKHLIENEYNEDEILIEREILLNSKVNDIEEIIEISGVIVDI